MGSKLIITPVATLSYPHLAEPQAPQNGQGKPKYSCALVFPPGADLTEMRKLVFEVIVEKFGKVYKTPSGDLSIQDAVTKGLLKSPFRTDVEMKGYPKGSVFINVRTENRPGLVTRANEPVTDPEAIKAIFYAGAKVRAQLSAFAYDKQGNRGGTFGLQNLQFIADGERIDGRQNATDAFTAELDEAGGELPAGMI